MIYVDIEQPDECDYRASATVDGVLYTNRGPFTGSVVARIAAQIAAWHDDQPITIAFPTVTVTHRSLWALAGIWTREQRDARFAAPPGADPRPPTPKSRRRCLSCDTMVTPPRVTCSNKCRQKAHRARKEAQA